MDSDVETTNGPPYPQHPDAGLRAGLNRFVAPYGRLVRRSESREALERYVEGLMSFTPRKTVSDIARVVPDTSAQRLQEFLTRTTWDSRQMDAMRIRTMLELATAGGGTQVLGTAAIRKKGTRSVGVARQYAPPLGRRENCQLVVTSHYADAVFEWPLTARLFLPESWVADRTMREPAKVPSDVRYLSRAEVALRLIDDGIAAGVPTSVVVANAEWGNEPAFLDGLEARGLPYLVEIPSLEPFRTAGDGGTRVGGAAPAPAERDWRTVAWRGRRGGPLVRQMARLRATRADAGAGAAGAGWLLFERHLPGHVGRGATFFARGVDTLKLDALVALADRRMACRDFYDMARRTLGFEDYEGRLWTGLHRHVALVMLAASYQLLGRAYGPPSEAGELESNGRRRVETAPRLA